MVSFQFQSILVCQSFFFVIFITFYSRRGRRMNIYGRRFGASVLQSPLN